MKYNALADDEESNQCFLGGLIIRNLSIWLDFFLCFCYFWHFKRTIPSLSVKMIFSVVVLPTGDAKKHLKSI